MNFSNQIYYWEHMLDECFDKDQLFNEIKATYFQKTKNESGKTYACKQNVLNRDKYIEASKTIKTLFDEVVSRYKTLFGFDLSYMTFKVDKQPVYTNGEPCYEYDFDECAGDRTTLGWIRLNPDMKSVMNRYGVDGDVNQFTKFIIAHELGHEVWDNIVGEDFKRDILSKAESENFSTAYLETVSPSKLREETFCEYMANAIVHEDGKSGFYKIDANDNVVEDCEDPIGKIGLSFYDDIKALGIGSFEIFPAYRRQGHGEAVLRKLVSKYRNKCDLIYCFVDSDNAPALSLYNKIGQVSNRLNDKGQYMVTFWKRPKKLVNTSCLDTVRPNKLAEDTSYKYLAHDVQQLRKAPLQSKMVFKKVPRNELVQLLDEIETYTESKRFKREKFEQYLVSRKSIDSEDRSMYYGLFRLDGRCLALSYLNKTPADCVLVAEIQCVVPGYGRLLLQDIISRSSAMWLAADPKFEMT